MNEDELTKLVLEADKKYIDAHWDQWMENELYFTVTGKDKTATEVMKERELIGRFRLRQCGKSEINRILQDYYEQTMPMTPPTGTIFKLKQPIINSNYKNYDRAMEVLENKNED